MSEAVDFFSKNEDVFLKNLNEILAIPTISSQVENQQDMVLGANWLSEKLKEIGLEKVKIHSPAANGKSEHSKKTNLPQPIVTAEKIFSDDLPTVLMYSHYDVQPVGGLEDWHHHPFNPQVKKNRIYARGSSDNKGPLIMQLASLESLLRTKTPMVNVKVLIEGEEEIGSFNTYSFIANNADLLQCDSILVTDTEMLKENVPALTLGVRGLAFLNLEISGARRDMHSGCFGGVVPNPILELAKILTNINQKKLNIADFYDGVSGISEEEKNNLSQLPDVREKFVQETGIASIASRRPQEIYEKMYHEPTFEINGIQGGEFFKTIIPAKVQVSLSCRLVGEQSYEKVLAMLKQAISKNLSSDFKVKFGKSVGGNPVDCDLTHSAIKKAKHSLERAFKKECLLIRTGGSVPILAELKRNLKAELVMMGFSLPEDKIHSPNESFSLNNFRHGVHSLIHFLSF